MNKLSPFKKLLITVGNLPTAYIESMSYYEGLTYLVNYICNNIDPNVIANTEAIKELQEYVTNYFDNLDVQEEINNKLDEMADSGVLAQIINVELIGSLSNLTTSDKSNLVSAINEVNGNINLLNLNTFTSYELDSQVIKTNYANGYGTLHVASNSNNTVCKIYGSIGFQAADNTTPSTFTIQTDLRPTENINIDGSVVVVGSQGGTGGYIQIKTNGEVVITVYQSNNTGLMTVTIPPCLYFVKNFGD